MVGSGPHPFDWVEGPACGRAGAGGGRGRVWAPWWLGLFFHALLAFPAGSLQGRWPRTLVGLLYVDVTVVQGVRLLFTPSSDLPGCSGCPSNLLLFGDRPGVAVTLLVVQQAGVGSE